MNCQARILFILKHREVVDEQTGEGVSRKELSSGLANSARFVHEMFVDAGVQSHIVQVIDNNDIDREVSKYKPTHVIIEAFWVVPEKFDVLQMLHPEVTWIIRAHSNIPFLANEGIAMDWFLKYAEHENVLLGSNSEECVRDFRTILAASHPDWDSVKIVYKTPYLPNFYPYHKLRRKHVKKDDGVLDIACFGAVRPLKNHLIQAVAAIEYAGMMGKYLRFHINGERAEQGGHNNVKNLRDLFASMPNAELVEEPWMNHDRFLGLLTQMDIGMQVTFTETFNIVSADMAVCDLPIVVSEEVGWAHRLCKTSCTSSSDIVDRLLKITDWRFRTVIKYLNLKGLRNFSAKSRRIWLDYIRAR